MRDASVAELRVRELLLHAHRSFGDQELVI